MIEGADAGSAPLFEIATISSASRNDSFSNIGVRHRALYLPANIDVIGNKSVQL